MFFEFYELLLDIFLVIGWKVWLVVFIKLGLLGGIGKNIFDFRRKIKYVEFENLGLR